MTEPVTVTTFPRRTVEELKREAWYRGLTPGDLTIAAPGWLADAGRIMGKAILGVDEDGYVWIDRRKPG